MRPQAPSFLTGETPPDFAPDNFEIDFKGRAKVADLTPLGRSQMGIDALTSEPATLVPALAAV